MREFEHKEIRAELKAHNLPVSTSVEYTYRAGNGRVEMGVNMK